MICEGQLEELTWEKVCLSVVIVVDFVLVSRH
jgi:hypothetical protein